MTVKKQKTTPKNNNRAPKIILWDIETTHNLVAMFKLWGEDYVPTGNIVQERYVVCASWKVFGESKVYAVSVLDNPALFKEDPHNDYHVLEILHGVLSEADAIVAHNGDRYDLKFVEGRMLIQGFPALPPIKKIDTLKVARDRFLFNSNKLDYLGQILGVGKKIVTAPGLWLEVLKGNKQAIKDMVTYNKGDVELLERVFEKLIPYIPNFISRTLFTDDWGCPRCGSDKVQSRGVHRADTRIYQRYQCQDCFGWFRKFKCLNKSPEVRVI